MACPEPGRRASASPTFRCQAFWLPKHGHSAEEYEDSWAADESRGRFAVADGATESSFAGQWARLLTADFIDCDVSPPDDWLERLPELQRLWWDAVSDRVLPWYAEEKRDQGAFATFLGLCLATDGKVTDGKWQALAIGDTCLFQVRGGELLTVMPLDDAGKFDTTPWLLGSRQPLSDQWRAEAVQTQSGEWAAGDQFWLLTDALAQWLLALVHADHEDPRPTLALPFEPTYDAFSDWVASERTAGKMRNDDCTWLVIEAC